MTKSLRLGLLVLTTVSIVVILIILQMRNQNNPPPTQVEPDSNSQVTKVAPAPRTTYILAFGDSGTGKDEQIELARLMDDETFDAVIHTGDVVYPEGTKDQINQYFDAIYSEKIKSVFYPSPGNHDYRTDNLSPYLEYFDLPQQALIPQDMERYYSFDIGKLHMIALDSNLPLDEANEERSDDMIDWLKKDLVSVPAGHYIIAYFHHPAFPGNTNYGSDERVLEKIVPLLDAYKVPLVLNGHNHNYSRTCKIAFTKSGQDCVEDGTVYITTGGGGNTLYGFNEPRPAYIEKQVSAFHYLKITLNEASDDLTVQAIGLDQTVLDSIVF